MDGVLYQGLVGGAAAVAVLMAIAGLRVVWAQPWGDKVIFGVLVALGAGLLVAAIVNAVVG